MRCFLVKVDNGGYDVLLSHSFRHKIVGAFHIGEHFIVAHRLEQIGGAGNERFHKKHTILLDNRFTFALGYALLHYLAIAFLCGWFQMDIVLAPFKVNIGVGLVCFFLSFIVFLRTEYRAALVFLKS